MSASENPIYDAPVEERLIDLKRDIDAFLQMLESDPDFRRTFKVIDERTLQQERCGRGECLIGNWRISPRWTECKALAQRMVDCLNHHER